MIFVHMHLKPTAQISFFVFLTIIFSTFSVNADSQQKMHGLENYYVTYEISGNAEGSKQHASQDYGRKLCWIEKSEINVSGNTIKKNEKVITFLEDGDQWIITINLDDNTGTKMKNPMYKELSTEMRGKSPKEFSEQFMKQMGGKVTGEKTVNDEKCTQWKLMGGATTCVTDDLIAVEFGADMAGISIKEVATDVKRNYSGPEGICDIGNAKIKQVDLVQ